MEHEFALKSAVARGPLIKGNGDHYRPNESELVAMGIVALATIGELLLLSEP
jgi:hypothetical protein